MVTTLSVFMELIFLIISIGLGLYSFVTGKTKIARLLPDSSSTLDLYPALPIVVGALTYQHTVNSIRRELETDDMMRKAVRLSLLFCSVMYALIGVCGYIMFGEDTGTDIVINVLQRGSSLDYVSWISYVSYLLSVSPGLFLALRSNANQVLFRNLCLDAGIVLFSVLTALLLVAIYVAAIIISSEWTLFQFVGSTSSVLLTSVFPAFIVYRNINQIQSRSHENLAGGMLLVAVLSSTIAFLTNFISRP